MLKRRSFLTSTCLLAFPAIALADSALNQAVAGTSRSPSNVARDRYRHPVAILEFFGLNNHLSVLEVEPGAGYWTEILAPYLKTHGAYRVAIPPVPATATRDHAVIDAYLQSLNSRAATYGDVIVVPFTDSIPLAPPNSIDLVLSFRNLHDWMANGTATTKLDAIYAALKRGGVFGIEDHRGLLSQPQDPHVKSGYVREDYAIALIQKSGFKLAGVSQIGDNPRDTKNYPKGVWTLPPILALGEVDRAKYLAIGESDRWTLKFIKPSGDS